MRRSDSSAQRENTVKNVYIKKRKNLINNLTLQLTQLEKIKEKKLK